VRSCRSEAQTQKRRPKRRALKGVAVVGRIKRKRWDEGIGVECLGKKRKFGQNGQFRTKSGGTKRGKYHLRLVKGGRKGLSLGKGGEH